MGSGIAYVSAMKASFPVRIKDISTAGINAAFAYSYQLLKRKLKRGFISKHKVQQLLANMTGATNYSGFKDSDVVIEAVFEDLALKQQMVADIENVCQGNAIFASNTSSLSISAIAEKAKYPEKVIGLHYFSPVDKMPLVEVIPHAGTADEVTATVLALAKQQGKTAIVVKDSAGFYVNRILAPYMNEAINLLMSGVSIENIDRSLVRFGFPVGPIQLFDEIGIDIAAKIGPSFHQALGEKFKPPVIFEQLLADQRLGKKNKHGFYLYKNKNKKGKAVDESVYRLLNIQVTNNQPADLIERCLYLMLNEAAECLAEGVISSARDGDIAAIFGIGFPAYLGGPFNYIDSLGAHHVVQKLNTFKAEYGECFSPCQALIEMATEGRKYY